MGTKKEFCERFLEPGVDEFADPLRASVAISLKRIANSLALLQSPTVQEFVKRCETEMRTILDDEPELKL